MLRDARVGCDKGNGQACFHAGVLYDESGRRDRSEESHLKGCSLRETASCDALATVNGPERERVLAEACSGGDLVSCTRLADAYPKDAAGRTKARALLEDVCRAPSVMTTETRSRDLEGAATGCSRLGSFYAKGEGGKTDPVLASRLDTLAAMLFTEALFRREKQEDVALDRAIATRPSTATERDRADREDEALHHGYEALLQALDAKARDAAAEGRHGSTPLTTLDEIFGAVVTSAPRPEGVADDAVCRDTGDPAACDVAIVQLDKTDPAAALQLAVAGCTKKPDQCWGLVAYAETSLKKRDGARATTILEKGCEAKSGNACFRLGQEAEQGERGIAQDLPKASRALDKACEYGVARACLTLAAILEDGRGVGRNPARAKQLRTKADTLDGARRSSPQSNQGPNDEQACRQNHAPDKCLAAATAFQETDAVKAEELHRVGCTANKSSCGLWTFAIDRMRRDDQSRGSRILEQGCEEGSPVACATLAEIQHLGFHTSPRNEARAAEVYQKACDGGDAYSCRVTASRFRAVKNAARADELRDLAQKAEDADPVHVDGEHWAKDASEQRLRGPQAQELARALDDWRALVERAKGRSQARTKKLESVLSGHRAPEVPPFSKEDGDASKARESAIKKSVGSLFQKSK
jgi:TPR repeat protein